MPTHHADADSEHHHGRGRPEANDRITCRVPVGELSADWIGRIWILIHRVSVGGNNSLVDDEREHEYAEQRPPQHVVAAAPETPERNRARETVEHHKAAEHAMDSVAALGDTQSLDDATTDGCTRGKK